MPLPPELDGRSLAPLVDDAERAWDAAVLTTHGRGNHTIRDERWRYIRYADGGEELYDHDNDPNEWTNLAGKPEFNAVKSTLAKSLPQSDAAPLKSKKGNKSE